MVEAGEAAVVEGAVGVVGARPRREALRPPEEVAEAEEAGKRLPRRRLLLPQMTVTTTLVNVFRVQGRAYADS